MAGAKSKTESISISLEGDLIEILDHVCLHRDVCRSSFIRTAIKESIAVELSKAPSFWNRILYGIKKKQSEGL
jgi:metal-responsive CopG/Arc/MetJ family transcriptional regulator